MTDISAIEERARALGFEIQEDSDQPGKWLWLSPNTRDGSDLSFDTPHEALANLLASQGLTEEVGDEEKATLQMTLVVDYLPNGVNVQDLKARLERAFERAVGEGLLTGETAAEVDRHSMDVKVTSWSGVPDLDQEQIADFIADRIENGAMNLENIPSEMARFGLMSPAEFVQEMDERMEQLEFGPYAESQDEVSDSLAALCEQTGTTPADWDQTDGPSTGVGVESWYVHKHDGREAYLVDDQGFITVDVGDPDSAAQASAPQAAS